MDVLKMTTKQREIWKAGIEDYVDLLIQNSKDIEK